MIFFKSSPTLFFYSWFLNKNPPTPQIEEKKSSVPRILLNRLLQYIFAYLGNDLWPIF